MHRPIPILQKADAALSCLINNLTSTSNAGGNKSNSVTPTNLNKTCDLNELIKLNQQQQQQQQQTFGRFWVDFFKLMNLELYKYIRTGLVHFMNNSSDMIF